MKPMTGPNALATSITGPPKINYDHLHHHDTKQRERERRETMQEVGEEELSVIDHQGELTNEERKKKKEGGRSVATDAVDRPWEC